VSSATRTEGTANLDVRALLAVQNSVGSLPGAVSAARGMSHFGEHALGWIAIGGIGALVDADRREKWASVAVGAVGAHAASIVVKRISRRRRPTHPSVRIGVSTPSKFSFPSSHATSTTAAALLIGRATGLPVAAAIVPSMLVSRLVLGVHYPSDVVVGSALGALSAAATVRVEKNVAVRFGLTVGDAAATTAGEA
jgi:membrane-associated phospholipid phosphatase